MPSQELLLRVSAYLELVTKSGQPGARHDRQVHRRRRDGVLGRAGAARGPCLARLRRGAAHPARHGGAERALAGGRSEAAQGPHRHPLRRRAGRQYRLEGADELHRDGRRREHRRRGWKASTRSTGTRICISHSVFKEAGERLCVRPIDEVTVKGRRAKIPIYELLGVFGAGDPGLEPDPATLRVVQADPSGLRGPGQGGLRAGAGVAIARYWPSFRTIRWRSMLVRRLVTV